jgi:hypothetical protein
MSCLSNTQKNVHVSVSRLEVTCYCVSLSFASLRVKVSAATSDNERIPPSTVMEHLLSSKTRVRFHPMRVKRCSHRIRTPCKGSGYPSLCTEVICLGTLSKLYLDPCVVQVSIEFMTQFLPSAQAKGKARPEPPPHREFPGQGRNVLGLELGITQLLIKI